MSTATATRVTYRKTGKGEWVAFGPASEVRAGATVTVTRASGETKAEYVERTGKPFTANGALMVYGYLGTAPVVSKSGCVANPEYCPRGCATEAVHAAFQAETAAGLNARKVGLVASPLAGNCVTCRCHAEDRAGQPGTILYDGCDRCGCVAA
jgi:hypothetical protein